MAFRGERFVLDLDSDDDTAPEAFGDAPPGSSSISIPGMIGEIRERSPAAAPAPPAPKPSTTGFPAHRRRAKPSAFKQRRAPAASAPASAPGPTDEKTAIAEENERQLASMSDAQIQQEREELMESMDTSLLERFLRRARIDADDTATTSSSSRPAASSSAEQSAEAEPAKDDQEEKATPAPPPPPPPATSTSSSSSSSSKPTPANEAYPDNVPPTQTPSDLHAAAELPPSGSVHFPAPPSQASPMPNLDPSSPSFLSDLQTHYFPNISHDPAALSWLQPPSADPEDPDSTSAYHPASNAEAVHPANLRFSLLGTVLSPATSLALPTTLGLHHHGKDPHAAGYTIPELAILSRSTFPAQRCIAWQVLGRILFRLGKGQFGDRGSPLVEGLWSVVEREGVVAGMLAEADGATAGTTSRRGEKGSTAEETKGSSQDQDSAGTGASGRRQHASATAWAVEGVWLWQMGGAGDRGVLKEGTIRSQ